MTAQIGERLFYKGYETFMATEPLSQYLRERSDISFYSTCSACWRGYVGTWEITDNKLYLIGLEAYIEGYQEVGLNYLFPGKNKVFANWFSGEIRIPQGDLLDYVHMGYYSLYERDLILVIENGILVNEYVVDNEAEYKERLQHKEIQKAEQIKKEAQKRKKEIINTVIIVISSLSVLIGTCIGVFNLIKLGTISAYLISAIIIIPLLLILGGVLFLFANKEKQKEKKPFVFISINIIVFLFIGVCIGVYYLIKWDTILARIILAALFSGILYLTFIAIKNRIKKKKLIN